MRIPKTLCLLVLLLAVTLSACGMTAAPAPSATPEPSPTPCPHAHYENGVCMDCGYVCSHPEYADGVCTVCGYCCPHEAHDAETGACTVCGQIQVHDYVEGVCVCGATPILYSAGLPEEYYWPCEHAGTVTDWSYTVEGTGFGTYTRRVKIYTPYGYDENGQYNVMILLHGQGDTEGAWLDTVHLINGKETQLRWQFDKMIEKKIIQPLIIVAPAINGEFDGYEQDTGVDQMAVELRENILPYIAENYATYAAGSSYEDLSAAREHYGMGGLSWGSYYTYASGMRLNMPLFADFICFSGNDAPDWVLYTINLPEWIDYPIDLYYSAAGTEDVAHDGGINCFYTLVNNTDRLTEGKNAFLHETQGRHEWIVWSTEMFNALQYAF